MIQPTAYARTTQRRRRRQPINQPVPPRRRRFNRDAFANLSLADQALFERFGQGPRQTPAFDTISAAFTAQAAAQPDAPAVEHLGRRLTYGDLARHANRLAARLAAVGVRPGANVGLFLQRSLPMVVGIMGILQAGAAYVPQHVGVAKRAHLQYVQETAQIDVILTLAHLRDQIPAGAKHIIAIDELMAEPFTSPTEHLRPFQPAASLTRDHTCFIIFTSGTTGNPNGVQVTHGNAANILLTAPGNLGMAPGQRVGQILSIAFDMAAWEILGSLSNGATLVIRGKDFMEVVRQVDVVIATPSILSRFPVEECSNVKVAAVAGEPCPRPLADAWSSFCTFYNSCGPTETTIVNTAEQHFPWKERLTIGRPTPNNTVYILNENREPCAIGEIGEMWAGGDCVSVGYIGNEGLTDERYRPDPFLGGNHMMFRTRDLGRWTPEGELEHFGRTDDQVKVRGFRVELDSVANALESTPGCVRAAALKLNSRDLVAFVSPSTVDPDAARQQVANTLPYYCTPKFVLALEALPLTSRGKIDKRQLLALAEAHDAQLEVA